MFNSFTCNELWNKCLSALEGHLDSEAFDTWFAPVIPKEFSDGKFVIEVPSKFFYKHFNDCYSSTITKTISNICNFDVNLEYIIKDNEPADLKSKDTGKANSHLSFIRKNFSDVNDISNLNPKYTFENFIEGDCNQLARSSAESISKKPLNNLFNPLMIYSDVGLGKTHLLHAIGNRIKRDFKDKNVVFIPTTVFVDQFINSIKENNPQEFSRFYTDVDVLLLDDIQFLRGKEKTQNILFYIFNQLHQIGKQIVITSDKAPNNLEGLEDRLVSRFTWGLTVNINVPDLETKIAILESKFSDNYNIPKHVLEYIAQRVNSNIRELEGVMITAIANVSSKNNIDIASIQKIINKIASNDLIIDRISNIVASYFRISIEDIIGKSRQKDIALARHMAMYFAKKHTKCSLKTIGSLIGGRDHSTVIHAINAIESLAKTQKNIKNIIYAINREVRLKTLSDP